MLAEIRSLLASNFENKYNMNDPKHMIETTY